MAIYALALVLAGFVFTVSRVMLVDAATGDEGRRSRSAAARNSWEGRVLAQLNRKKRYPQPSVFQREQGMPWIRLIMDRTGKVLSVRLERSSGFCDFDREALDLPWRAQPLPALPETSLARRSNWSFRWSISCGGTGAFSCGDA